MRYYSIMRPVMPGSYPKKAAAQETENFDEKTFCEEIGREAWGYIDYSEELTESEAADYELVPAKENKEEITNKIDALFEELVPASGKADTVAGEIIRAVCRIGYRWFNDGDMVGVGYGKETCNPAARYLAEKAGKDVRTDITCSKRRDPWIVSLSAIIGENYCCKGYRHRGTENRRTVSGLSALRTT